MTFMVYVNNNAILTTDTMLDAYEKFFATKKLLENTGLRCHVLDVENAEIIADSSDD